MILSSDHINGFIFVFSIMYPEKKEWFKTWFNTPYYQILYQNRNEEEAKEFVTALLKYLNLAPHAFLLDVACGTGRFSRFLAAHGFNVTGVDLSTENIELASKFETERLSFFVHDMREIFYVNYFNAVFNFFTSFGYFNSEKDNLKAIRALSHSLKKGGKLIIDFFNSQKVIAEMISQQQVLKDGILFSINKQLERNIDDKGHAAIVKRIYFRDQGKDFQFEERVQALLLEDFKRYFSQYHLRLTEVFGSYQLNPFDANSSDRMIMIAEKI